MFVSALQPAQHPRRPHGVTLGGRAGVGGSSWAVVLVGGRWVVGEAVCLLVG